MSARARLSRALRGTPAARAGSRPSRRPGQCHPPPQDCRGTVTFRRSRFTGTVSRAIFVLWSTPTWRKGASRAPIRQAGGKVVRCLTQKPRASSRCSVGGAYCASRGTEISGSRQSRGCNGVGSPGVNCWRPASLLPRSRTCCAADCFGPNTPVCMSSARCRQCPSPAKHPLCSHATARPFSVTIRRRRCGG